MKKIVIATKNLDKFSEIKTILKELPVEFINLRNTILPEERGNSLEENAIIKAETGAKLMHTISISDDTGLEVDALNGLPGVYSSRFAGINVTHPSVILSKAKESPHNISYEENRKKLLKLLESKPMNERKAKFRCVVAVAQMGKRTKIFEGKVYGYITEEERGKFGFGYDSIFMVPKLGKTFAELPPEKKNKISHRALALLKAKKYLKNQLLVGNQSENKKH
ncbi:MAG: RdgB/HAM1 family non-canonical purine NTP pyrophosphatase [bacterium]|nr:RdgB/HAM1 family non-canonical purine NTP pyrophosphatase [bacterium]